jgi:DNA adenine methylase
LKNNFIKSPLNYVGGKYKLLPQILPLFPTEIDTFVDLFAGGCNVGVNIEANHIICNDIQKNLMSLMDYFKINTYEEILSQIESLIKQYGLTDTSKFGYGYYGCNSSDGVAKVNKDGYLKLRNDFNSVMQSDIMFYTMVIHAFNNSVRFNSKGEFNVAVNKRDFNGTLRKNLELFVTRLKTLHIKFTCNNYTSIKLDNLNSNDFIYADPPYLITCANYNENGGWTENDEQELLLLLDKIHNKGIKFALSNVLLHKGKENEILLAWSKKYNVHNLNHSYGNSNYHTKDKSKEGSQEVLITNY